MAEEISLLDFFHQIKDNDLDILGGTGELICGLEPLSGGLQTLIKPSPIPMDATPPPATPFAHAAAVAPWQLPAVSTAAADALPDLQPLVALEQQATAAIVAMLQQQSSIGSASALQAPRVLFEAMTRSSSGHNSLQHLVVQPQPCSAASAEAPAPAPKRTRKHVVRKGSSSWHAPMQQQQPPQGSAAVSGAEGSSSRESLCGSVSTSSTSTPAHAGTSQHEIAPAAVTSADMHMQQSWAGFGALTASAAAVPAADFGSPFYQIATTTAAAGSDPGAVSLFPPAALPLSQAAYGLMGSLAPLLQPPVLHDLLHDELVLQSTGSFSSRSSSGSLRLPSLLPLHTMMYDSHTSHTAGLVGMLQLPAHDSMSRQHAVLAGQHSAGQQGMMYDSSPAAALSAPAGAPPCSQLLATSGSSNSMSAGLRRHASAPMPAHAALYDSGLSYCPYPSEGPEHAAAPLHGAAGQYERSLALLSRAGFTPTALPSILDAAGADGSACVEGAAAAGMLEGGSRKRRADSAPLASIAGPVAEHGYSMLRSVGATSGAGDLQQELDLLLELALLLELKEMGGLKRHKSTSMQMPPMMHSLPQPMTSLQAGGAGALGGFTAPAQQRLKLQDSSELDEQVMLQIMWHASVGGATDAF